MRRRPPATAVQSTPDDRRYDARGARTARGRGRRDHAGVRQRRRPMKLRRGWLLRASGTWPPKRWRFLTPRLYEQQARLHQEELSVARDAALEASRLKSAFVANITHEIRTPLNVILGYADLMAERLADINDENALEYGEPIRRAGQRLLDTIGAVLDLSRIESGAFELRAGDDQAGGPGGAAGQGPRRARAQEGHRARLPDRRTRTRPYSSTNIAFPTRSSTCSRTR